MADFSKVPSKATIQPKPFRAHIDDQKLSDFKQLLKLSPVGPAVYENTNAGRQYGTQREWLIKAKKHWETSYDWRKQEDYINSFPNFTVPITDDDGVEFDIHFLALFSEKEDAIPIAFYHGWPGSFFEFLSLVSILKKRYSPQDLPYHIIVPSLPGYAFSSGPPVDVDYNINKAAATLNKLMEGLGFKSGYLAQGGDLGSAVSRYQAANCDSCKGMHLNMVMVGAPPSNADELPVDELEKKALPRGGTFRENGFAYALEHGTRTGTIGLALSSSPLALLSWIGEKFLEWTDEDPSLDEILSSVTLYWLTDTFPRCIYPYRGITKGFRNIDYVSKPFGYSFFPKELAPVPKSWAATTGNLVSYGQHKSGGHFAAMEQPEALLGDVEEWVKVAWGKAEGKL